MLTQRLMECALTLDFNIPEKGNKKKKSHYKLVTYIPLHKSKKLQDNTQEQEEYLPNSNILAEDQLTNPQLKITLYQRKCIIHCIENNL